MATSISKMRTSYFQVKDTDAFVAIINNITSVDVTIEVSEKGIMLMGDDFSTGIIENIDEHGNYVEDEEEIDVFELIKNHLSDGEAVLVNDINYENFRYLAGASSIITPKGVWTVVAETAVRNLAVEQGALTREQADALDCTY